MKGVQREEAGHALCARICLLIAVMSGATRSCSFKGCGLKTMQPKTRSRSSGGRSRTRNGGPLCLIFPAHASSYMLSRERLSACLSIASKFFVDGVALALFRFDFLLGASVVGFLRMTFFAILLVCAIHLSKFLGVAPPWLRWDLRIASIFSLGSLCGCPG